MQLLKFRLCIFLFLIFDINIMFAFSSLYASYKATKLDCTVNI